MIGDWFDILARLLSYFRLAGTLSVLAWLSAVAAVAVFAWSLRQAWVSCAAVVLVGVGLLLAYILAGPLAVAVWALLVAGVALLRKRVDRTAVSAGAVAVALLGVLLGAVNSDAVSAIEVDRTQELLEARKRQEELRAEKVRKIRSASADINFVEDSDTDRQDLAGKTVADAALLTGTASSRPAVPAYKTRGKRRRDPSGRDAPGEGLDELAPAAVEAGPKRMMKAWDVIRADRLDRVNLFAVRFALLAALLVLAADYLTRFNLTFGSLLPVPVAGRLVDALAAKRHAVLVESADDEPLRRFLETSVRKGESFIYMGPADPFAARPPTRPAFDVPARLLGRGEAGTRLHRLPLGLWPVRLIAVGDEGEFPGGGFVFESAWFGRHCFTVTGAARCRAALADVLEHLRMRHVAKASARRSVDLVWHFDEPPAALDELAWLARETNFRLVVWSAAAQTSDAFDERVRPDPPPGSKLEV